MSRHKDARFVLEVQLPTKDAYVSVEELKNRDGNSGTVPDTRRIPDTMGTGTGTIFYPRVAPVPDPNRDRYRTGIFLHPWVTQRVPDTLLPL
jgi:hypothetical protein